MTYAGSSNGMFSHVNGTVPLSPVRRYLGLQFRLAGHRPPGPARWVSSGGSWSQPVNWLGRVPNAVGAKGRVQRHGREHRTVTVTLDVPQTVGTLEFGTPAANTSYTLSGGTLTLNNSSGTARR